MGSCETPPGGDAAECCPVEMLRSAVQWRCCKRCLVEMLQALPSGDAAERCLVEMLQALSSGDAAKRCLVEMLQSAAQWRCCGVLLALLDEGTVA